MEVASGYTRCFSIGSVHCCGVLSPPKKFLRKSKYKVNKSTADAYTRILLARDGPCDDFGNMLVADETSAGIDDCTEAERIENELLMTRFF